MVEGGGLGDVVTQGWRKIRDNNVQSKLHGCVEEILVWSRKIRLWFREDFNNCKRRIEEL